VSDADDYAANVELAAALPPAGPRAAPTRRARAVATPGKRTIADVAAFLGCPRALPEDADRRGR
jgi:prolyl-tRNA synthetase